MKDFNDSGYPTDFSGWTGKSDRVARDAVKQHDSNPMAEPPPGLRILRNSVLIILMAVALVWTIKVAAGW